VSDLKTEYKGCVIVYAENQDIWRCWSLDVEAPTLSAVKRKIDVIDRQSRRTENVDAYLIAYGGDFEPVTVTLSIPKNPSAQGRYHADASDRAWIVSKKDKKREKVGLERLIEHTPENEALIREAERLGWVARQAAKAHQDFLKTIPKMGIEALLPAADEEGLEPVTGDLPGVVS
jgi:hypothetical protein